MDTFKFQDKKHFGQFLREYPEDLFNGSEAY